MTTILIKKKDTAGAPAAGDLTNAAGGTEIAVNTATKRIYTKDSGGTVVELGTFPTAMAVQGNLSATGTLAITGATNLNGAVTLGDASADNITVTGTITSNLIFTDATYDIGASGANRPRDLFLSRNLTVGGTLTLAGGVNLNGNVTVGDSSSDTLTINSTVTSNLIFTDNTYDIGASGATRPRSIFLAGNATVGGLTSGRVTFAGTGGLLSDSANLTWDGTSLSVVGRLYNGSASTFGASTWGMSLGNGGASANYFKASTTYWQNNAGTQILQLSAGDLTLAGSANAIYTGTGTTGWSGFAVNTTGGSAIFGVDDSTGSTFGTEAYATIIKSTSKPIYFKNGNTSIGKWDTGGLNVYGTVGAGSGTLTDAIYQRNQATAGTYWTILHSGTGLTGTYPDLVTDATAGSHIRLSTGDLTNDFAGVIDICAYGKAGSTLGNYISFSRRTGVNTTTESGRFDSSGNFLLGATGGALGKLYVTTGNVSQAAFLSSNSGTSQQAIATLSNSTNGGYISVAGVGTSSSVATWSNGSMVIEAVPYSSGNFILGAYTGSLVFQTGRNNVGRFDASGNFMVGTTTASGKLTVYTPTADAVTASFTNLPADNNFQVGFINGGSTNTAGASIGKMAGFYSGGEIASISITRSGGASAQDLRVVVGSNGVYLNNGGTSWASLSDERQKTDLTPIEDAVAKVATLRAVTGRYLTDDAGVRRAFLIAQDVQAVLPEAVDVQPDEQGTLGLQYTDVIPLLVASIKEQQKIIGSLKARLDAANI